MKTFAGTVKITLYFQLDLNALEDIDEELRELVKDSVFIDAARCDALCAALRRRVEMLESVVLSRRASLSVSTDPVNTDVAEDMAYSGGASNEDD